MVVWKRLVEAAGIEPATPLFLRISKAGQNVNKPGLLLPQVGQAQEVTFQPPGISRTDKGPIGSIPGLAGSTTRAQQEHNGRDQCQGITPRQDIQGMGFGDFLEELFPSLPLDLQKIVIAWPRLAQGIKNGILTIVLAMEGKGDV